jgi:hypothetical protein
MCATSDDINRFLPQPVSPRGVMALGMDGAGFGPSAEGAGHPPSPLRNVALNLSTILPSRWAGTSALGDIVIYPGAMRQAGMDRASGPPETLQIADLHPEVRTGAPKARTISNWGNAPIIGGTKQDQEL